MSKLYDLFLDVMGQVMDIYVDVFSTVGFPPILATFMDGILSVKIGIGGKMALTVGVGSDISPRSLGSKRVFYRVYEAANYSRLHALSAIMAYIFAGNWTASSNATSIVHVMDIRYDELAKSALRYDCSGGLVNGAYVIQCVLDFLCTTVSGV